MATMTNNSSMLKVLIQLTIVKGYIRTIVRPVALDDERGVFVTKISKEAPLMEITKAENKNQPQYVKDTYAVFMVTELDRSKNMQTEKLFRTKQLVEYAIDQIEDLEPNSELRDKCLLVYNKALNTLNNVL